MWIGVGKSTAVKTSFQAPINAYSDVFANTLQHHMADSSSESRILQWASGSAISS